MAYIGRNNLTDYIPEHPCVECFKGKDLDALIVLLLAMKAGYTLPDDLTTLTDGTVCLTCYTDTQLKESLAAFLWEQQSASSTAAELMVMIKCFQCMDPLTLKALYGYLLVLGLTPQAPT